MADELTDEIDQTGETTEPDDAADREHQDDEAADNGTYPAKIVKDLRKENASYRERARTAETRADDLARQLFRMRVDALGKLADPDDLPFNADLLSDGDKLTAAVEDLIAKRPHYAKRRANGPIGQGERDKVTVPQNFSGLLH